MTKRITDLALLTSVSDADRLLIVDTSDTSEHPSGSSRQVEVADLVEPLRDSIVVSGWMDILPVWIKDDGANGPTLTTYRGGVKLPAFIGTGTAVKEVMAVYHIPHDYKLGTDVLFHVHWKHIIASPGVANVHWQMEVIASKAHGQSAGTAPITLTMTIPVPAQYVEAVSEIALPSTITAELEPDSTVLVRLFRDPANAADTFGNDVFLVTCDLHAQTDMKVTTDKVPGAGWVKA